MGKLRKGRFAEQHRSREHTKQKDRRIENQENVKLCDDVMGLATANSHLGWDVAPDSIKTRMQPKIQSTREPWGKATSLWYTRLDITSHVHFSPKQLAHKSPNITHGISLIFASPTTMYALILQLTLGSATSESCTERSIVMRQIQNILW